MNFNVRIWKEFNETIDYDHFVEEYMTQWLEDEMYENDADFEKRCVEAWRKVLNYKYEEDFGEEEGDEDEGDDRITELTDEYIREKIADPRVDKYEAIVEKREQKEMFLEKMMKERMEEREKMMKEEREKMMKEDSVEKADRVKKLREELRSLGEIC